VNGAGMLTYDSYPPMCTRVANSFVTHLILHTCAIGCARTPDAVEATVTASCSAGMLQSCDSCISEEAHILHVNRHASQMICWR
jgi:hypothetical protein